MLESLMRTNFQKMTRQLISFFVYVERFNVGAFTNATFQRYSFEP